MALLNILAKSKKTIDWKDLSTRYSRLNLEYIELFPIPKELGFSEDGLGLNIHKGYPDKNLVINQLEQAIIFLDRYELTLTELYNGAPIDKRNCGSIANQLLP